MRRALTTCIRGVALTWCIGICLMWLLCHVHLHRPALIVWRQRTQVFVVFEGPAVRAVLEHDSRPEGMRMRGLYVKTAWLKERPPGSFSGPEPFPLRRFGDELEGWYSYVVPAGAAAGATPPPFPASEFELAGMEAAWGGGAHPLFANGATFQGRVMLPYWLLVSVPALLWAVPLGRLLWRAFNARKPHACVCGYDLRASPARCPECGRCLEKIARHRTAGARDLRRALSTFVRWSGPGVAVAIVAGVWAFGPHVGFAADNQVVPPVRGITVPAFVRVQGVTMPDPLARTRPAEQQTP